MKSAEKRYFLQVTPLLNTQTFEIRMQKNGRLLKFFATQYEREKPSTHTMQNQWQTFSTISVDKTVDECAKYKNRNAFMYCLK